MISKTAACALTLAVSLYAGAATAQEFTPSHLDQARAAITATGATDSFDGILFNAAATIKNQLTANSPDKADQISSIVDEEAIKLAARRGDLENEAARLFASTFSEEELKSLADFFNTPAGQKYMKNTPILARELGKSARIWANGINRDLANNSAKKLASQSQ